jgi:hypothetical protein
VPDDGRWDIPDSQTEDGVPAFTDFGWVGAGRLDLRVFNQDQWWVDIHGRGHRLEEMSRSYRRNVIGFLIEHQEAYFLHCLLLESSRVLSEALAGRVAGELLVSELGGVSMAELTPSEWLESTSLMRRLRRLG